MARARAGPTRLADVNVLATLLAAFLGGALTIIGGYVASSETLNGEQALRQADRDAAFRGAVRVLDLELFARAQLILNAHGIAHPPGPIHDLKVRRMWSQRIAALADLPSRGPPRERSIRTSLLPEDTRLVRLSWTVDDRRVIASRVSARHWFVITVAVNRWSDLSARYPTVRRLRPRERGTQTAVDDAALATVRSLVEARDDLYRALTTAS